MVLAIAVVMVVLGYILWSSNDFGQPNANISINQEANLNTGQLETISQGTIILPDKTDCTDELDTECWNTYINRKIGYELKYPHRGWRFYDDQVNKFGVFLTEWSDGPVNIQGDATYPTLNDLSIEQRLEQVKRWHQTEDFEEVLIDDYVGIYFITTYAKGSDYVPTVILPLKKNTLIFDIQFIPTGEKEDYYKELFLNFVKSIKFFSEQ